MLEQELKNFTPYDFENDDFAQRNYFDDDYSGDDLDDDEDGDSDYDETDPKIQQKVNAAQIKDLKDKHKDLKADVKKEQEKSQKKIDQMKKSVADNKPIKAQVQAQKFLDPELEAAEAHYKQLQGFIDKLSDSASKLMGRAEKLNKTAKNLIEFGGIQDDAIKQASAALVKDEPQSTGSADKKAQAAGEKAKAEGEKKQAQAKQDAAKQKAADAKAAADTQQKKVTDDKKKIADQKAKVDAEQSKLATAKKEEKPA